MVVTYLVDMPRIQHALWGANAVGGVARGGWRIVGAPSTAPEGWGCAVGLAHPPLNYATRTRTATLLMVVVSAWLNQGKAGAARRRPFGVEARIRCPKVLVLLDGARCPAHKVCRGSHPSLGCLVRGSSQGGT
jgi:hypothetical protein